MVLEYMIGTVAGAAGGILITAIGVHANNLTDYTEMKFEETMQWLKLGAVAGIIAGNMIAYGVNSLKENPNNVSKHEQIMPFKELKTIDNYLTENNYKISFPENMSYKI